MSTSKLDTSGIFDGHTGSNGETHLSLPADVVQFHKNGIVFPCGRPIPDWREMTVELHSPKDGKRIRCTGIVISCKGSATSGYTVSMVFLNLSERSSRQLNALAVA